MRALLAGLLSLLLTAPAVQASAESKTSAIEDEPTSRALRDYTPTESLTYCLDDQTGTTWGSYDKCSYLYQVSSPTGPCLSLVVCLACASRSCPRPGGTPSRRVDACLAPASATFVGCRRVGASRRNNTQSGVHLEPTPRTSSPARAPHLCCGSGQLVTGGLKDLEDPGASTFGLKERDAALF